MRKRIAVIDREKCHPDKCGNYLCAKLCPVNRTGAMCITPGEPDKKARIDELLCTGCGICPNRCPFGAITIINLPENVTKDPLHRYGENMFELYSLPSPLFGQVVGIVGKNGIGKSTALKIMGKMLTPNLGKWDNPPSFKEVIDYFKGSETQKFLQKLERGELSLSYKPQQVDLIPKQFTGSVQELLEKIAAKEEVAKIAKELHLEAFLDSQVSEISGGELQRVAIAATVLKKTQLYLFDEPTSYLDIKQRIHVSEFVRSLSNENNAIVVIEHDLLILDYMTDFVNIIYGTEGVFGVVSGIKSSREGINAFLDGYLKEENVRFRDHPIKFGTNIDRKTTIPRKLISWKGIEKKAGHFTLKSTEGTLYHNEIIGIVGENGIGKTTFIKMLAGIFPPDKGEIDGKLPVAYKPQYLETSSDLSVGEFLEEAVAKYMYQIIKPLDLEKLFTSKLSTLSGGQLQRVAIARALSSDAKLFLLDEPSAYLDVEQRLAVTKVIRNLVLERDITILIVDHDLMFLDTLSDRLMVFTGVPAKEGMVQGPFPLEQGMNFFLKELGITLRKEINTQRPRINKKDSVKDREQRAENKWYYS